MYWIALSKICIFYTASGYGSPLCSCNFYEGKVDQSVQFCRSINFELYFVMVYVDLARAVFFFNNYIIYVHPPRGWKRFAQKLLNRKYFCLEPKSERLAIIAVYEIQNRFVADP